MKRCGSDTQYFEYSEIFKATKRYMKENIRQYDEEQRLKALE